ncbi:pancreatic triacylglycerol lipase-like [Colias croceus]|uniref:pancreatic triacylglycerol lipase-like n=1 Tax=Colias crocea TaxID=72248 RepID=UPI001E27CF28|nr:pancreatic triacylglycerol lipase-like [Colias croceus]
MEAIRLLILCLAVITVSAVPAPLKNDGNRYVWFSDDDGESQLVDLVAPVDENLLNTRNGANNAYWLYTRRNTNNPQSIINGDANSVRNSNYNSNVPLKIVVHGWTGSLNSVLNARIKDAFLAISDVNVVVVDWHALAAGNYVTAVVGVPSVGQHLGNFVNWLLNTGGGNWNNVHFVGFSLGAHIVGIAGRQVGGRARRVTGLDPAGPLWYTNSNALNRNAGQYVEVIHTNVDAMGIRSAIGDTDFYPNGGRHQPGCNNDQCAHSRAYDLFASSIRTNHFQGRLCSNLNQALSNQCSGNTLNMGNGILNKNGNGIYGLSTGSSWPY